MRWLPVAVLAFGFVVSGWRNLPPMPDAVAGADGVAIACAVLLAWWVGRRSGRAAAFAAAYARAEARATAVAASEARAAAQAAVVVNVGQGARHVAAERLGGLDAVEWRGQPRELVVEQDVAESLADELGIDAESVREFETG